MMLLRNVRYCLRFSAVTGKRVVVCRSGMMPVRQVFALFVLVGLALLNTTSTTVQADGGLLLTADSSHIIYGAGKPVQINLQLLNSTDSPIDVALEFVETPSQDWNPRLMGRTMSYQVRRVSVPTGDNVTRLRLVLDVPEDTVAGNYTFKIGARSLDERFQQSLTIIVTIEGEVGGSGAIELESRFPFVSGPTGAIYEFSVTFENRDVDPTTVTLSADGPSNWEVAFKPAFEDKFLTSISLRGHQTESLKVLVTPPRDAPPGEYTVRIIGGSGDETAVSTDLKITLTGDGDLLLGTPSDRLNAKASAGKETAISLILANLGSGGVKKIDLLSRAPEGWEVKFEPTGMEEVQPGELRQFTASIHPPGDTIPGDYSLTIIANSQESADTLDLRISVTQSTLWGWFGLTIIVLVIIGLGFMFVRLGRR